ncbi:MAG: hypothetical protein NTW16_15590 [Bacteroidetes bacterium]|nr:hypothetical protein [Bacteroidota bacterium]
MPVRRWIWPMALVSIFIFILSLRQLSDPDLGFHLKYGKWIVANLQIPLTDQSTYTVAQHPYIDLHWLFQVILYGVFTFTGYSGISVFICILSLLLSWLILLRLRMSGIPVSVTCFSVFAAFLIMEPRIAARPEMVTFLFLTGTLFILDLYAENRKNLLFLLPLIMLLWCNMHALFILGIIVLAIFFTGMLIRDKKPDKVLLAWAIVSTLVCLINPYGMKGFTFPVELLTRFDPHNIYNQHIQEFLPFFSQPFFVLRDYLFMALLGTALTFTVFTYRKRQLHEILLLALFGFLAIGSIRNIPLFVLIAIPIISRQALELSVKVKSWRNVFGQILYPLMIIAPLAIIPRLVTNAFYTSNNSFTRTGMGIDAAHQPVQAAAFILNNHLKGRVLNSIGFGGWLSWTIPQPVFMDGRLEVMQESIYKEVTQSWNGGLPGLIDKHSPQLIVYNYLKYYPWTMQLRDMSDWRLIYSDGIAAIFASKEYAVEIDEIDLSKLASVEIPTPRRTFRDWVRGFYRKTDDASIELQHLALLRFQMNSSGGKAKNADKAVLYYNHANLKYNNGNISGALADYDSAILLQPAYSKAYNNRGILRASAFKDFPGAIIDFTKAIDFNPNYGDAYLGRGTAFFLLHDTRAACRDWERARSLGNSQAARLIEMHCNRQ